MEQSYLQDRVSWGLNVAARHIGRNTDAYRPHGPDNPLAAANRFLRLPAAFSALDGKFTRPNGYGAALWHGIFDSAYTRPGDFLVQNAEIWFVAAQQKLLPILCVQINRTIRILRPAAPGNTGLNPYGGVSLDTATTMITEYPASILGASAGGRSTAGLPADTPIGYWTVLLPTVSTPNGNPIILQPADLLIDDLGRTATISGAEMTDLGWRLTVRQVSS